MDRRDRVLPAYDVLYYGGRLDDVLLLPQHKGRIRGCVVGYGGCGIHRYAWECAGYGILDGADLYCGFCCLLLRDPERDRACLQIHDVRTPYYHGSIGGSFGISQGGGRRYPFLSGAGLCRNERDRDRKCDLRGDEPGVLYPLHRDRRDADLRKLYRAGKEPCRRSGQYYCA